MRAVFLSGWGAGLAALRRASRSIAAPSLVQTSQAMAAENRRDRTSASIGAIMAPISRRSRRVVSPSRMRSAGEPRKATSDARRRAARAQSQAGSARGGSAGSLGVVCMGAM